MKLLPRNTKPASRPVRSSARYQSIKAFIAGMGVFVAGVLLVKTGTAYFYPVQQLPSERDKNFRMPRNQTG